jgi:hypothetical protein
MYIVCVYIMLYAILYAYQTGFGFESLLLFVIYSLIKFGQFLEVFLRYFWVFFLFMIGKITAENETILNLVY